ncbi:MAG: diaminopimelate epimerase [Gemmatimonadota bacterium]|nr:diaminopimelate epimerase [Gemmatimonadota bacterium]
MVPFAKYTGAGNDFVIARADPRSEAVGPELARRVCARRTGVGVDGLILVRPRPGGIRARFFNPDGSEFSTCGNGSRCAARFARDEGLTGPGRFVLETSAGEIGCEVDGERVALEYRIRVALRGPLRVPGPVGPADAHLVEIGVPHLVVPLADLPEGPIEGVCRPLRHLAELGPGGANVNLVSLDGPGAGGGAIRTFERGVEGETLACGSGSMAAAFALRAAGLAGERLALRVRGGDTLEIHILDDAPPDGGLRRVGLAGPAVRLFEGAFPDAILAP